MFKTLKQIFREARRIAREESNLLKANKRVESMTLDYAAMQTIVNAAKDVEISIRLNDGTMMKISPYKEDVKSTSFRDKFNDAHTSI